MKKARYYVKNKMGSIWIKDRKFGTIEAEAKTMKEAQAIADALNKEDQELFGK